MSSSVGWRFAPCACAPRLASSVESTSAAQMLTSPRCSVSQSAARPACARSCSNRQLGSAGVVRSQRRRALRVTLAAAHTSSPATPAPGGGDATSDFAEALLRELGVPAERIAGTLAAAATLQSVPHQERPLAHCTADSPKLTPEALAAVESSSSTTAAVAPVLPWQSSVAGVRDAWAGAVRGHLEVIQSLGLSPSDAAAALSHFPYALLIPAQPGLRPTASFLAELGLSSAELAGVIRAAPRLLGFSPQEHLEPAVAYLRGCGLHSNALCGLLRSAPMLALQAIEYKARTDRAAEQLGAAYKLQTEERATWAMETAMTARQELRKRGW